jgi:hypothetical protein
VVPTEVSIAIRGDDLLEARVLRARYSYFLVLFCILNIRIFSSWLYSLKISKLINNKWVGG